MDNTALQNAFDEFREKVRLASGGTPFKSFHDGLPHEWESYKLPLRDHALSLLESTTWKPDWVGSGKILERVIRAIEIDQKKPPLRNNLVSWENRFGHANRSHRAILDAAESLEKRRTLERLFFEWFSGAADHEESFEHLAELCGRRYDLLGYLFFLRDAERFMPIRPVVFGQAFEKVGIDLVTQGKASWANYAQFMDGLRSIQQGLAVIAKLSDLRLVDAHSFCWMLMKLDPDADALAGAAKASSKSNKRDPGKVLDARERSIFEMANTVEATVKGSLGPPIEKLPKLKELRMSRPEITEHIRLLMDRQGNQCALTGIPLQFRGEEKDIQLLPSLDRIDSNKHYELENLQVVCRFINFWKSNQDDDEFRRLLSLVRGRDE